MLCGVWATNQPYRLSNCLFSPSVVKRGVRVEMAKRPLPPWSVVSIFGAVHRAPVIGWTAAHFSFLMAARCNAPGNRPTCRPFWLKRANTKLNNVNTWVTIRRVCVSGNRCFTIARPVVQRREFVSEFSRICHSGRTRYRRYCPLTLSQLKQIDFVL